ncbi:hypothetical protein [Actinoallomurus sp. NPDC050550]|uniref:hypothetical protein n=1 Tax=Actinoallomurus sp. NPDC050550 TaxID=3154937 RepID=UPI0033FED7DA
MSGRLQGAADLACHVAADHDEVLGSGDGPESLAEAAGGAGVSVRSVPDTDAAIELLSDLVRPSDVVLVKASSEVGLLPVAAALKYLG